MNELEKISIENIDTIIEIIKNDFEKNINSENLYLYTSITIYDNYLLKVLKETFRKRDIVFTNVIEYNEINKKELHIIKIDEKLLIINKKELLNRLKEVFNGISIDERSNYNNYFYKYFLSMNKEEYISKIKRLSFFKYLN